MKYILLLFFLIQLNVYSQVGIGLINPESDLHIKENIQLSNQINIGGTATTKGNPGLKGQVLTSKGTNNSLEWKNIKDITIVPLVILNANNEYSLNADADINTIVPFEQVHFNESHYIDYDSNNNEFIVRKPGVYRFILQITSKGTYCYNPIATSSLIKTTLINGLETESIITGKTSDHGNCTTNIHHNISGVDTFDLNDKIKLYTLNNRSALISSSLIILFTGTIEDIETND